MDELRLVAGAILAGLGAVGGAIGVGVAASVSYTHLTLPTKRIV